MCSVKNSDIPKVFEMFGEVFVFLKKYYNAPKITDTKENKELFWNEFIADSEKIVRKYDTKLCNAIVLAITDDINTRSKENN